MREVAIVGAGMTPFAEHFSLGIKDLLPMAFAECAASVDKGLAVADIPAAWFGELSTTDGFPSGILADTCGLLDIPVTHVENACATGNDAVRNAVMGIASGFYDVVLVVGGDKVRESASKDTLWEPSGLYAATPQSDGAAALLLAAADVADRYTSRPVRIRGVGLGLDRVMHQHKRDMTTFPATVRAAKAAFAMAGLTPADVDVAEVHDCFTGVE